MHPKAARVHTSRQFLNVEACVPRSPIKGIAVSLVRVSTGAPPPLPVRPATWSHLLRPLRHNQPPLYSSIGLPGAPYNAFCPGRAFSVAGAELPRPPSRSVAAPPHQRPFRPSPAMKQV
jgi:hypothetical protein